MSRTLIGAFQDLGRAREAVRQLEAQGFSDREVSLLGPEDKNRNQGPGMRNDSVTDGASWGAGIGGTAGLLAAAGVIAIPGIGPLLAAGPLAAALTGAAAGGVAGGFMDMGIPAASGKRYEEELRRGHAIVTVQADDAKLETARGILEAQGAHDVEED